MTGGNGPRPAGRSNVVGHNLGQWRLPGLGLSDKGALPFRPLGLALLILLLAGCVLLGPGAQPPSLQPAREVQFDAGIRESFLSIAGQQPQGGVEMAGH
jgi:hypothetical protein